MPADPLVTLFRSADGMTVHHWTCPVLNRVRYPVVVVLEDGKLPSVPVNIRRREWRQLDWCERCWDKTHPEAALPDWADE